MEDVGEQSGEELGVVPEATQGRQPDERFSIQYIEDLLQPIEEEVYQLMRSHRNSGHGYDHIIKVTELAYHAMNSDPEILDSYVKICIVLAAYLHEVDDRKLFGTDDYANARMLLQKMNVISHCYPPEKWKDLTIRMISLISCSSNGNAPVRHKWMAIPRDADRIQAIGHEGIRRCYDFTVSRNAAMYTSSTLRPKTLEEMRALPPSLLDEYVARGGKSDSMMDHYPDKLLWMGNMASGNAYLEEIAKRKMHCIEMYYWAWSVSGIITKPDVWDGCCKAIPHRELPCELTCE